VSGNKRRVFQIQREFESSAFGQYIVVGVGYDYENKPFFIRKYFNFLLLL
jgi:hypothetical protein